MCLGRAVWPWLFIQRYDEYVHTKIEYGPPLYCHTAFIFATQKAKYKGIKEVANRGAEKGDRGLKRELAE